MKLIDPGVDHMSAMKVIDEITDKGGKSFIRIVGSYQSRIQIGGIINSTWAPRNVVLAGQGDS
jgi:hypothetical protein